MKCRYCNITLAPLRRLTDGEFCCDDHRHAFLEEQAAPTEVSLQPLPQGALLALTVTLPWESSGPPSPLCRLEPREFKPTVTKLPCNVLLPWTDKVESILPVSEQLLPLHFSAAPVDSDTGFTEEF